MPTYTAIKNVYNDLAIIQPPEGPSILRPPVDWKKKLGDTSQDEPFLELFQHPRYQPDIKRNGMCPPTTMLLRNHWETYNTTDAVAYGGFDKYNIHNIPSCSELNGPYMNYGKLFRNPEVLVASRSDGDLFYDTHGYSWVKPMSCNLESRFRK